MAGLVRYPGGAKNRGDRGRTGRYYARIYIRHQSGKPKALLIPLKTDNEREAAIRLQEVKQVEDLIKQGIEFSFPWINGAPTDDVLDLQSSACPSLVVFQRKIRI